MMSVVFQFKDKLCHAQCFVSEFSDWKLFQRKFTLIPPNIWVHFPRKCTFSLYAANIFRKAYNSPPVLFNFPHYRAETDLLISE